MSKIAKELSVFSKKGDKNCHFSLLKKITIVVNSFEKNVKFLAMF